MIFAVHKRTKEHRIVPRLDVLSNADWRYFEADADGWIERSGGECPLPMDSYCDVRYRDGDSEYNELAGNFLWTEDLGGASIISYRPIPEPQAEQVKEWRGPEDGLPPVGLRCEYVITENNKRVVEITAHSRYGICFCEEGARGENYVNKNAEPHRFRPIRTDRERWIEAAMEAGGMRARDGAKGVYGALYDAGLARLPGE